MTHFPTYALFIFAPWSEQDSLLSNWMNNRIWLTAVSNSRCSDVERYQHCRNLKVFSRNSNQLPHNFMLFEPLNSYIILKLLWECRCIIWLWKYQFISLEFSNDDKRVIPINWRKNLQVKSAFFSDIEAECQDDYMKIRVGFNGTFSGLVYSAGNYNVKDFISCDSDIDCISGYAYDPDCMYINGTGRDYYEFYIQLNRCGTLGKNTHNEDNSKAPTVNNNIEK